MQAQKQTIAPPCLQINLFYLPPYLIADCNAAARNAYGTAAQEIACRTLKLNPIPINGNYTTCFDAEKSGTYYEIKSVHKSGKIVIYDWRMKKEETANVPLLYCIVIHERKGGRKDILNHLLIGRITIAIVKATFIHKLARIYPLNFVKPATTKNKRHGYNRAGYIEGYRNLPVSFLLNRLTKSRRIRSPFTSTYFTLRTQ